MGNQTPIVFFTNQLIMINEMRVGEKLRFKPFLLKDKKRMLILREILETGMSECIVLETKE
ncbi:MAG: hypothetical protein F6K40_20765 [Okeania sp. SIO3I5]|nr:hypothetical protein [Okeania sp. SIO3I5]